MFSTAFYEASALFRLLPSIVLPHATNIQLLFGEGEALFPIGSLRDPIYNLRFPIPRVEAGYNTSTVAPAGRERRRKGNLVVSDETSIYGYGSCVTLTTHR
jgi:hypothetical protein